MPPSSITILHSSPETYFPLLFAVYFTDNIFTNLPFCMKNLLFQNQSCFEKPLPKKDNKPIFWLFCVSQCMVVTQAATLVPSNWKCRKASRPTLLLYKKFSSKDLQSLKNNALFLLYKHLVQQQSFPMHGRDVYLWSTWGRDNHISTA
jgi:hypothetical protein